MINNIPPVTKNLLIINVLFFVAKMVFESKGISLDVILGAFYPESPNFQPWQIITHMFMHGNFAHILFNMFGLWMFGSVVEQTIGAKKYLMLYFLAGLCGFALFNLVNYLDVQSLKEQVYAAGFDIHEIKQMAQLNLQGEYRLSNAVNNNVVAKDLLAQYITPMVGASGAIYGLLVAFAVLFPDAKLMMIFLPIPIKAKYFIPIILLLELYSGMNQSASTIAHFAHLGGALVGWLFIRNWKKNQFRKW